MSFTDTLERYNNNNLEALAHETNYYHRLRGTIYQRRREYFIRKKAELEDKLRLWGKLTLYEYKGEKTFRVNGGTVTNGFTLTTIDGNMDEVEAFIEWKTNCTVIRIERRLTEIGTIRS